MYGFDDIVVGKSCKKENLLFVVQLYIAVFPTFLAALYADNDLLAFKNISYIYFVIVSIILYVSASN